MSGFYFNKLREGKYEVMNKNSPDLYAKEIQGVIAAWSQLKIKFIMHEEYISIV